jgi:CheY-like chemotaxis protein
MAFDPSLHDMLIFVTDDDTINLKLLKTLLKQAGFKNYLMFQSGEELLEEIKTTLPDLILLDIMMPGLTGYDIISAVKEDPRTRNVPIVMLTAAAIENDKEPLRKCFELGAQDYISKPFSGVELIMRVQSALKLEKQRQQLELAAEKISSLERLLPICSYCKKVRTDQHYWQDVEVYIAHYTDAKFSHSICPECYELYIKPQLDELKNKT